MPAIPSSVVNGYLVDPSIGDIVKPVSSAYLTIPGNIEFFLIRAGVNSTATETYATWSEANLVAQALSSVLDGDGLLWSVGQRVVM